jgi:hypothetical protein
LSFLSNLRAYSPRVARFIQTSAMGNDKQQRPLRLSITVMLLLIIGVAAILGAGGSLFAAGVPSMGLTDNVSINAVPPQVQGGQSLLLIVTISHTFPHQKITVSIRVTGPSGSGVDGTKTVTITTDSHGSGQAIVTYPFTSPFVGKVSTSYPGAYHATASFVLIYPIATASTTFTVFSHPIPPPPPPHSPPRHHKL